MMSKVSTVSISLWRILSQPGNVLYAFLGTGVQSVKWNPPTGVEIEMRLTQPWYMTYLASDRDRMVLQKEYKTKGRNWTQNLTCCDFD